ncbi:MAG: CotH kinase family protein [Candidatus Fibromonas sp.]|jgi:hypothetical protein|nr:CotH kinase family protein [Candidatus Fibromonas sp.]
MRMAVKSIAISAFLSLFLVSCSDGNGPAGELEQKPVFAGNPPVVFSEIYTANADYKDEYGKDPGWVEFYNPADTAVNLKGFSLTDNASKALWAFGEVTIQPYSYLMVFLSGNDKPNLEPARDSIDLINNAVGAWSWADSQNDPAGGSTAQFGFSKTTGLSGTLVTTDNLPALNWASAVVMLKLGNSWSNTNSVDISKTDRILLRGYLSKNSKLEIRLAQNDIDDWKAWPTVIKGSGQENDLYSIELPQNSKLPDLANIYGIRFSNVSNNFGTVSFSFNSIVAHKQSGNIHASFELKKGGGKLFLLDSLEQIRDSVAYPAETRDLSFAKNFESGKWAFSKPPTPNSANSNESYEAQAQPPATGIPRSGHFENELSFTLPPETESGIVRCDTSGALPSENSTLKSGSSLTLAKTAILRCAVFKSGAYPSEPIMRTYIIGERLPDLPVVSIAVNPRDMFDSTTGLYATGPNAGKNYPYFGANYWEETELPIQMDFFESGARLAWSYPAGLQIFGNYSRANPKKSVAIGFRERYGQKNLKYTLLPEHPDLRTFKWFILRNNGGNYGKDYIRDMLMSSLTEGLGIDYQKGRAVIVYYNGEYYGIHNLRERSNGDYFETNYGIDETNLDLVKGTGDVSRGSDADYLDILRWVEANALSDENLEQLKRRIDLDNYTNYLHSEIYFLNKDWPANNLKRWRTISPPSKWKWFLYDTDYGFGGYDEIPNVKMLDFATEPSGPEYPNPPSSTLLLRKLLQNENYKNAFINRFSLLLSTYFAPARVEARINALMQPIAAEIPLDQKRWRLNAARMDRELATIREFGRNRPAQMQAEMEEFFGLGPPENLTVSARGNGKILIHDLPLPGETATFKVYSSTPIAIKAVPASGAKFNGWSDGVKEAERTVVAAQAMELSAEFYYLNP